MNRNVPLAQAGMDEVVLPAGVQEALGQLVGSAKEGLLALSVGVGLGVLAELTGARRSRSARRSSNRRGRRRARWSRAPSSSGRGERCRS